MRATARRSFPSTRVAALKDRNGCLLANHGMIAVGPALAKTMWLAEELETLAKQYFLSLQIGDPVILSDGEIAGVLKGFATYGVGPIGTQSQRCRDTAGSASRSTFPSPIIAVSQGA